MQFITSAPIFPCGVPRPNGLRPAAKALPAVLHQRRLPRLGHLMEAQPGEEHDILRLGVEEKVAAALLQRLAPQEGEDSGRQVLALVVRPAGHAFDHIVLQGRGGDDRAVPVPHEGGVPDTGGVGEPRFVQKGFQLLQRPPPERAGKIFRITVLHSCPPLSEIYGMLSLARPGPVVNFCSAAFFDIFCKPY